MTEFDPSPRGATVIEMADHHRASRDVARLASMMRHPAYQAKLAREAAIELPAMAVVLPEGVINLANYRMATLAPSDSVS